MPLQGEEVCWVFGHIVNDDAKEHTKKRRMRAFVSYVCLFGFDRSNRWVDKSIYMHACIHTYFS